MQSICCFLAGFLLWAKISNSLLTVSTFYGAKLTLLSLLMRLAGLKDSSSSAQVVEPLNGLSSYHTEFPFSS